MGGFNVYTQLSNGTIEKVVPCARRITAKNKARARRDAELNKKPSINVGYIPKDRAKQLAAFKRYAEARRKQGRDDDATVWDMRATALEQDFEGQSGAGERAENRARD